MMANLSENDRRALRFGGIGVGVVAAMMLLLFPAMDKLGDLNKREQDAISKLNAVQTALDDQLAVRKALGQLREQATVFNDRKELNQQTALMLRQVESLPAYTALNVRRLEGLPIREEKEFFRSAVSMQFSGNLQGLHRFLSEAEKASPALKVDRLTITADAKNASRIDGQMVITGYALVVRKGKSG